MNIKIRFTLLCLFYNFLMADLPNWEYNPGDWEFTSWIVGAIVQDGGNNIASSGDVLAAFDEEGNVRGIAVQNTVGFGPYAGQIMYEMTMGSNADGDIISFQYYDSQDDIVLNISETYSFTTNEQQGSLIEPIIFTISLGPDPCNDDDCTHDYILDVSRNNYAFQKEAKGLSIRFGKKYDGINWGFNLLKVKDDIESVNQNLSGALITIPTSSPFDNLISDGRNLKMNDYLVKPFDVFTLSKTLDKVIKITGGESL